VDLIALGDGTCLGVYSTDAVPDVMALVIGGATAGALENIKELAETVADVVGFTGTIEEFARRWFNSWGIGTLNAPSGARANRGMLLLVSVGDRKARIELGADWGRGANGYSQSVMAASIIPAFKRGDYSGGIAAGDADVHRPVEERVASRPVFDAVQGAEVILGHVSSGAVLSVGMLVVAHPDTSGAVRGSVVMARPPRSDACPGCAASAATGSGCRPGPSTMLDWRSTTAWGRR
jgi:hypothetical protein